MSDQHYCDFCGRSEIEVSEQITAGAPAMAIDEDGLWVCRSCRTKLSVPAVGEEEDIVEDLRALVGKSAGAICHTLNLPYKPPYDSVIDAASKIAYDEDRYMSAWTFVNQWPEGTTVWQNENGSAIAVVALDGSVSIRSRTSSWSQA